MQIQYEIQLDQCFAAWLTDPLNGHILDAVQSAADALDRGDSADFDFGVFDRSLKCLSPHRRKLPTLKVPAPGRAKLGVIHACSSLPSLATVSERIDTFYGPKPVDGEREFVDEMERSYSEEALAAFLSRFCKLPKCFARVLRQRFQSWSDFAVFWRACLDGRDPNERFFRLVVGDAARSTAVSSDLLPFVREIVRTHRSLEFLVDEPMFQEKFIDFIATRCFFIMDTELRGTVGLQHFRKMDLASVFYNAENMADVNDSRHIFNYQHFYVVFCKFWDIDGDSDELISKNDLLRFNEFSISPVIAERLFRANFYPLSRNKRKNYLDFTSFAYFLMSSEDKSNLTAINFWYKLCDLDDDGVLSIKEIEYLYDIQFERMKNTGNETIPFDDIFRQLMDMINPNCQSYITIHDLVSSKMADVFFNTISDLQKFLMREYQYPLLNLDMDELTKDLSKWEIYVMLEYDKLTNDD